MTNVSIRLTSRAWGVALVVGVSAFLTLAATVTTSTAHEHVLQPADRSAPAGPNDIAIVGFAFDPAIITLTAGSTITWTNADPFTHTTTSDIGSLDPWNSGELGQNATFSKTFNTPGRYDYHCELHALTMRGTVFVIDSQPQPPTEVTVDGPTDGVVEVGYTFTATVNPLTVTQPLTYVWQADNQVTLVHQAGLSDTAVFTWSIGITGTQWITVTASNSGGSIMGTHFIIIGASRIYLPLIMR